MEQVLNVFEDDSLVFSSERGSSETKRDSLGERDNSDVADEVAALADNFHLPLNPAVQRLLDYQIYY